MDHIRSETVLESGVPIWKKYILTVNEAVEYFNISNKKIRKLVDYDINSDSRFALLNGTKILIKRKKFEEFLDAVETI